MYSKTGKVVWSRWPGLDYLAGFGGMKNRMLGRYQQ